MTFGNDDISIYRAEGKTNLRSKYTTFNSQYEEVDSEKKPKEPLLDTDDNYSATLKNYELYQLEIDEK